MVALPLRRMRRRVLLTTALLLLRVAPVNSQVLVGEVERVVDGDTIDVRLEGDDEVTRVRMQGIDAPETDQPMSDDAVALLRQLLGDGAVELQPAEQTSYERIVARVFVDGADVNAAMVRRGLAMAERRYLREFDDGESYCVFEHAARSDKLGIWRLPPNERIPPWYAPSRGGSRGRVTDYSGETVEGCVAAIGKPLGSTRPGARPALPGEAPSGEWSCAVRKTCGQMRSCEEAQFYLRQCRAPIDGDDDGVPCEDKCP